MNLSINIRKRGKHTNVGSVVLEVEIKRSNKQDGSKKDDDVFTAEQAKQTAENIKAAGSTAASIVIPDDQDEVAELNVTVPQTAQQWIKDADIEFGISSLADFATFSGLRDL